MKKDKIIYWSTTAIVAVVFFWSALNFAFNEAMKGAFAHFGLPDWFRFELTAAKILGALALLIPAVPAKLKEFAYAGCAITMASAIIAHSASGDGIWSIDPLVFLTLLAVSYYYFQKTNAARAAPASSFTASRNEKA